MSYTVIDVKDFEGRRTPVAQALGALAIRANQFDSQPGQLGHEHDELKSGHHRQGHEHPGGRPAGVQTELPSTGLGGARAGGDLEIRRTFHSRGD